MKDHRTITAVGVAAACCATWVGTALAHNPPLPGEKPDAPATEPQAPKPSGPVILGPAPRVDVEAEAEAESNADADAEVEDSGNSSSTSEAEVEGSGNSESESEATATGGSATGGSATATGGDVTVTASPVVSQSQTVNVPTPNWVEIGRAVAAGARADAAAPRAITHSSPRSAGPVGTSHGAAALPCDCDDLIALVRMLIKQLDKASSVAPHSTVNVTVPAGADCTVTTHTDKVTGDTTTNVDCA